MATLIEIEGMSSGYVEVLQQIRTRGSHVAPRGQRTLELEDVIIEVADPHDALPLGTGRKLNPAIGAIEAIQLIGAFSDPELTCKLSSAFERFREPDGFFWGAYGERVGAQVVHAVRKLQADHDTRQAVATLWNGYQDNVPGKLDYPCTVALIFSIRDGALRLHTTMRSNDAWLGLPYDVFQFTQLQAAVAGSLGLPAGRYTHHVVSLHLYERDLEASAQVHTATSQSDSVPRGFIGDGLGTCSFVDCLQRAREITTDATARLLSPLETWYWEQLHG